MAQDPSLTLRNLEPLATLPPSLQHGGLARSASATPRQWAIRFRDDAVETTQGQRVEVSAVLRREVRRHLGGRWIVAQGAEPAGLLDALAHLLGRGGNGYAQLERRGFIALSADAEGGPSGGSHCALDLRQLGDRLGVRKRLSGAEPRRRIDVELRLEGELRWIERLPPAARHWFPTVLEAKVEPGEIFHTTRFFHGYTMAERLCHRDVPPAAVVSTLGNILEGLARHLYGRARPKGGGVDLVDEYPQRIRRRFDDIRRSTDPIADRFRALIEAPQVYVNGRRLAGPGRVMEAIAKQPHLWGALGRATPEPSHGDLILDNIMTSHDGRSYCLLDPNIDSATRWFDIGKLGLSLLSAYEALKYDFFSCALGQHRGCPTIDYAIDVDVAADAYTYVASQLPDLLVRAGVLRAEDRARGGTTLLLLNLMQNLSLPMFHLLHHRRPDRAAVFLALALERFDELPDASRGELSLDRVLLEHNTWHRARG